MNRIALTLWLVALALLTHGPAMADVKKWVDARGRVHYGDWPPTDADATPMKVRPNVIETEPGVPLAVVHKRSAEPEAFLEKASSAPSEARKDIQAYVDHCRENRGSDCEHEAHAMIDGPAPVIFPGDPAVFPRPDLKRPPPGLTLKYGITPLKYSIKP
jgi:hypothetical protein